MSLLPLCAADDIAEGESAAFDVDSACGPMRLMVIRKNGTHFVYINACPHRRLPLDFQPGRFLAEDGEHILCTNHIALLRIEDGACVDGPCRGQRLTAVPCHIREGTLYISTDPASD
ncbi:MAG: Rieske (2Fe-2S) protein [Rhodospirillales bacterium]|nr:Rieske (2Fe-2S) protein [Rhodospirillales bacterium]